MAGLAAAAAAASGTEGGGLLVIGLTGASPAIPVFYGHRRAAPLNSAFGRSFVRRSDLLIVPLIIRLVLGIIIIDLAILLRSCSSRQVAILSCMTSQTKTIMS